MAFNSSKVERLLRSRGIKAVDYFSFVYPERSGNASFLDIVKNTNPKAETIERIADLLGCSIDELFDRQPIQVTGDNNTVGNVNINSDPGVLEATIKHLQETIKRQDEIIADQNRRIDQLIELAKR